MDRIGHSHLVHHCLYSGQSVEGFDALIALVDLQVQVVLQLDHLEAMLFLLLALLPLRIQQLLFHSMSIDDNDNQQINSLYDYSGTSQSSVLS